MKPKYSAWNLTESHHGWESLVPKATASVGCTVQRSSVKHWFVVESSGKPRKIMEVLVWQNVDDHTDHFWHITKWLPYFYFLFFLRILLIQHTHCRVCWSMNVNDPRPAALWRSAVWWWINWHLRLHWPPGAVNKHHFNRTSTLHSKHSKRFVFSHRETRS